MQNFAKYLLKDAEKNQSKIFINSNIKYSDLILKIHELKKEKFFKDKNYLFGLILDLSEEFLIFYLTIIYSGNTVVLLEKGLKDEEYINICKKIKIKFLITNLNLNKFKDIKFCKNTLNHKFKNISYDINFYKFKYKIKKIKEVAIVLLTSGSTGEKKAVMLSHKNLIANTESILKFLPINKQDTVNLVLPISYSFGLSVLNTHLKKKAKIFIHRSPFIGSVINELKKYKCSSFYGVPSTYEILFNSTDFYKKKFPHLKYIAQAGGHLSKEVKEKLFYKFKNKFYIMYGATEASPRLSYIPPSFLPDKIDSIGKPIPGVKFKLFKYKNSNLFQIGAKGKNIMLGYLNNLGLTRRKIINGYFLTGDLGYKDSDGFFYIKKRIDKIVKIHGYKINLNKIEKVILKKTSSIKRIKIFISDEKKIILIAQIEKYMKNKVRKKIEKIISDNCMSYEAPDEIILTYRNLLSFNKKISVLDIYNKLK